MWNCVFLFYLCDLLTIMYWCCVWQHGGDINATDHTGQTALHWSAVRGAIQAAELLLQEGARVNAADMNGYQVRLILFFSPLLVYSRDHLIRNST